MRESEMYLPVKNWLKTESDYNIEEVYAEVLDFDIVATLANKLESRPQSIILEMKLNFNDKVISQAIRGLRKAEYVYVVIPKKSRELNKDRLTKLKTLGIGLILVENGNKIIEYLKPRKNKGLRNHISKYIKKYNKDIIGGVPKGEGETPYSLMKKDVLAFLKDRSNTTSEKLLDYGIKELGWVTIADIVENVPSVSDHYSNPKSALLSDLQAYWNKSQIKTLKINNRRYFGIK